MLLIFVFLGFFIDTKFFIPVNRICYRIKVFDYLIVFQLVTIIVKMIGLNKEGLTVVKTPNVNVKK